MWTLAELVDEAEKRIAALPPPKNGQVRAVPDERTVRYYAAIGLLDKPAAMKGRVGLYDARHLAQIVAIKRLQGTGKSLGEIQTAWPTMDAETLSRMSGVAVTTKRATRSEFWKREPATSTTTTTVASTSTSPSTTTSTSTSTTTSTTTSTMKVETRIEIGPGVTLAVEGNVSTADLRAIRAAAAPLLAELARRGITSTLEEAP